MGRSDPYRAYQTRLTFHKAPYANHSGDKRTRVRRQMLHIALGGLPDKMKGAVTVSKASVATRVSPKP
jgi:hypothetical protein